MKREREKNLYKNGRNGYGFDARIRQLAKQNANGCCQWAEGCDQPHNNSVDHVTGIELGRLIGIPAEELTCLDNAQLLCTRHADIKFTQEQIFVRMIRADLQSFQPQRAVVSWDEMRKPTKKSFWY